MSAPTITLCRCGHGRQRHDGPLAPQCTGANCICLQFRPGLAGAPAAARPQRAPVSAAPTSTKRCTDCGETKPRTEFYARGDGSPGVSPRCRDCDNARPRTRTLTRVVRVRARHRALAELTRRHNVEFRDLLDYYTKTAMDEAAQLSTTPAAGKTYGKGQTVRLRPGQRRAGQTAEDRIDVARCPECIGYHDRGHVCENCGQAPTVRDAAS